MLVVGLYSLARGRRLSKPGMLDGYRSVCTWALYPEWTKKTRKPSSIISNHRLGNAEVEAMGTHGMDARTWP